MTVVDVHPEWERYLGIREVAPRSLNNEFNDELPQFQGRRRKMPYRRKYGKRKYGAGQKLPAAVAVIARDMNYNLKRAKLAQDLANLGYGTPVQLEGAKALYNERFNEYMKHPGSVRGRGLYTGAGAYHMPKGGMRQFERWGDRFLKKGLPTLQKAFHSFQGSGLYTGQGEYDATHSNNLVEMGASSTNSVPLISGGNDETGSVTICHREYLSDIYGPGTAGGSAVAFSSQTFALNPALQATFPWLSQIACNYDEYEFQQLLFTYRSTTTDIGNSSNGQCGTVIMATNYNASSSPWADKQQMLEYAHAHDCKLTEHMVHGVECDPAKGATVSNCLYTRANPVVTGQDLKTYDKGLFQISLANCPTAYNGFPVGELWVEYTVTLRKAKLFSSRGLDTDGDLVYNSAKNAGGVGCTVSSTANNFFGTNTTAGLSDVTALFGQQNNIGCQIRPIAGAAGASNLQITFPASFTGSLKIRIIASLAATAVIALNSGTTVTSYTGNVAAINDLIFNGTFQTSMSSVDTTSVTGGVVTFETHVYVTSATQGVNNQILLLSPSFTNVASADVLSLNISVEQYFTGQTSSQNPNSSAYRPVYVKGGVVTTPS